jgi:hypothetical protein
LYNQLYKQKRCQNWKKFASFSKKVNRQKFEFCEKKAIFFKGKRFFSRIQKLYNKEKSRNTSYFFRKFSLFRFYFQVGRGRCLTRACPLFFQFWSKKNSQCSGYIISLYKTQKIISVLVVWKKIAGPYNFINSNQEETFTFILNYNILRSSRSYYR